MTAAPSKKKSFDDAMVVLEALEDRAWTEHANAQGTSPWSTTVDALAGLFSGSGGITARLINGLQVPREGNLTDLVLLPRTKDDQEVFGLTAGWVADMVSFYVAIIPSVGQSTTVTRCVRRGVGLRFEGPSESGAQPETDRSIHDYWHCQPWEPSQNGVDFTWPFPDRLPTIPVPASDQLTLLLCALQSLYGTALSNLLADRSGAPTQAVEFAMNKIKGCSPGRPVAPKRP